MTNQTDITMEFLEELFDALTSHICVVDRTGHILLTNAAWQNFAEQNNGAGGCGGNYLEICSAASKAGCVVARDFASGLSDVLENRVPCFMLEYDCHSPTEERWFICRITRLMYQDHPLAVVSHQNITPKILAEKSLEQNEALFKATFDQALTGMVQCSLDGRFTMVNRAFCRMTGYREFELLRASFMDITLPEDIDEDISKLKMLLDGDIPDGYTIEKRYIRKDKSIIWVNLHVTLVRNNDGSPLSLVGVVEEITQKKQAEARAQELNLQLEQRLNLLTQPVTECGGLEFKDLFDIEEIQKLQDLLSSSLGVASIITDTNGMPITKPSNFSRLCRDIIRKTEKGVARCINSNACFSVSTPGESIVGNCHSAGLMDGGTTIFVGNRKIANWMLGQVIDESFDTEKIINYADEIGADREQFREALSHVQRMGKERFMLICDFVAQIAHQLSAQALRNYQQARSIEERIRTEEALKLQKNELLQTSHKLQTIIETIGDGITLSDSSGKFFLYNQQMKEITGYSMDEANAAESFMHLLYNDPQEQRTFIEELALLEKYGSNHNVESTITAKDGTRKTLSVSSVLINIDGENHYLTAWHDFTNRKLLTDALIASEKRFATIAHSAGDAIIMMNSGGFITYWNPVAEKIFGYRDEEIMGRNLHRLLATQNYQQQAEEAMKQWRVDGTGACIGRLVELTGRRKNGNIFPLELVISSVIVKDEWSAIGILRDTTERHRVAEELRSAKEAAEAASKAKSNFLANMSHELRTPLNSVIGFTELVYDGIAGEINEQQQEYLGNVLTSARHLLQIISEILDLSRIEAGKLKMEIAPTNLDALLLQVHAMFSEQFRNHGVNLSVSSAHPEGFIINVDEVKIRQVIINLISNALKFTDPGGEVKLDTTLKEAEQGEILSINVTDTGIGIKEEDLPRLFKEFSQIEPAMTRNKDGTGLGLALSKRLIELHGGNITVKSSLGQGSCFTVALPITDRNN